MKDEVEKLKSEIRAILKPVADVGNDDVGDYLEDAIIDLATLIQTAQVEAVRAEREKWQNKMMAIDVNKFRLTKDRLASLEEYKQTPEEEFDQHYMGEDRGGADFASD